MDNSDTHSNILKVIAENQAASMLAYQKSIEASQKQGRWVQSQTGGNNSAY